MTENGTNNYWIQADSSGKLNFRPAGGSSETTKVVFDSAGNVGIGTYSPSVQLHVKSSATTYAQARIETGADGYDASVAYAQAGTIKGISGYDDSTDTVAIKYGTFGGNGIDIDSSGNVGIGTSSPNNLLTLEDGDLQIHETSTSDPLIQLSVGGTQASPTQSWVLRVDNSDSDKFQLLDQTDSRIVLTADGSGNVGIGITSPSSLLHVAKTSGTDVDIARFSGASSAFNIKCSDLSASTPTWTLRTFSGETLAFGEGLNESARFDGSGNFLVATTSTTLYNGTSGTGFAYRAGNELTVARSGASVATFVRQTSDGDILSFKKDGTLVGSIGSLSGVVTEIVLDPRTNGASITGGTNKLSPGNQNGALDAHLDLGSSTHRFKDLYLSGTLTNNGTGGISINTSGNVGIGTSSPSSLLHVQKAYGTDIILYDSQNYGTSPGASPSARTDQGISWYGNLGTQFGSSNSFGEVNYIKSVLENTGTGASAGNGLYGLTFGTRAVGPSFASVAERMRIDSSGNLLINGTSKITPYSAKFVTLSMQPDPSEECCPILELVGNRNANPGNQNGMIQFFNKTSTAVEVGRISSIQGSATNSGEFNFQVANAGTLSEAMRIDSSGNVGIGTDNPGHKLEVATNSNVIDAVRIGSTSGNEEITLGNFNATITNGLASILTGSKFGGIIQGGENGKLILGIRDNDTTDSVDIVSGSGNYMTDNTYDKVVARFLANGNVGIGTNPEQKLDINGTLRFTPNTADTNYSADIAARYDSAHPFQLSVKNNGTSLEYFGVYADSGGANNRVVLPNGNVGIGTTSPKQKLHVNGTMLAGQGATNGSVALYNEYNSGSGDYIANWGTQYSSAAAAMSYGVRSTSSGWLSTYDNFSGQRGTLLVDGELEYLSGTSTSDGTAVGSVVTLTSRFKVDSIGRVIVGDQLNFSNRTDSSFILGDDGTGHLSMYCDNTFQVYNYSGGWVRHMALGDTGDLVIGGSTGSASRAIIVDPVNDTGASRGFRIRTGTNNGQAHAGTFWECHDGTNGELGIKIGSSLYFYMQTNGVMSGDFNDTSDRNLKENITALTDTDGLDIISQLNPVTFDWKDQEKGDGHAGFIAQEVEEVLPNDVSGQDWYEGLDDEDKPGKSINVTAIVAHTVKAIQQLKAENDALRARIETLENS